MIRDPLKLLQQQANQTGGRRYKHLHTSSLSSACGVERLRPGERYLIGGNLNRKLDRLTLDLCRSYVEHLSDDGGGPSVGTKEFQSLLENCNKVNKLHEDDDRRRKPKPATTATIEHENREPIEHLVVDQDDLVYDGGLEREDDSKAEFLQWRSAQTAPSLRNKVRKGKDL